MTRFLLQRIGLMIPTIFFVSVIVFSLQQLLPGDPALTIAGDEASPDLIAEIRAKYHLDDSLLVRYGKWVAGIAQGDLGISLRTQQTVVELLKQKIPVTLELATLSMIIALTFGVSMGILAATSRGGPMDYFARCIALFGISMPAFWLGILFILLFAVKWRILPASGYVPLTENLRSMVMPATVLGLAVSGVMMRHTRSAMLQVLSNDYVRTARAKGLAETTVIFVHALRNAALPVITLGALEFGQLLSGTVLTETVFSMPGFGKLVVDAVFNRDYAVVQGAVLCTAAVFLLLNLFADLAYAAVNPRLRGR
ncbi:ABC transporter permease [Bradyrhizobium sp. 157]|uniref:ABC transporter permease n=1 Tax=Bradyrhizobium sp. 157 TaxID=2782631 RepID=UPI001FFC1193|nr:ABC transporter permease [Bradyrhizobium sp. 157]MCK1640423.1 ABC transporter permease [Bradyrhizobium sp. 157]